MERSGKPLEGGVEAVGSPSALSTDGAWPCRAEVPFGGDALSDDPYAGSTAPPALETSFPVAPLPRSGERLRDRFVVLRELGGGCSGVVFLARDEVTGKEVALKVLRSEVNLPRLKREYRCLRDLAHPHVLCALELYADASPAVLVMPYVRGEHLDRALDAAREEERPALTRGYFAQLALALRAVHRVGLVHRDLKPSNVLVSSGGLVQLIDFGLATPAPTRGFYGTPAFVAPELLEGQPATSASDWYSLGVMLYLALSGRLPFVGTVGEVLRRKTQAPAPPLPDGVPSDLAALTAELLRRDPRRRPSEMRTLRVLGVDAPSELPRRAPFVGRQRELAQLTRMYEDALGGHPRALEIVGPSGIGKTSLVRQFLAQLDSESARPRPLVLSSVCYENEHGAFHAIDDAISRLVGRHTDDTGDGIPLSEAFAQRLRDASVERPVLLFIDNAQWADADSARVLIDAWPSLDGARVSLVLCTRDDQRTMSPFLRYAHTHAAAFLSSKLALGAMSSEESTSLFRLLGGGAGTSVESAKGNPLIVSLMASDPRALSALDGEAQQVGAWLALAGHPVERSVLERAIEGTCDVLAAAHRLEVERWIGKTEHHGVTMLTPTHDFTRARLLQLVEGEERRRAMHFALGRALATSSSSIVEEIGEHYHRADALREFLPYARESARRAERSGAFARCAMWLERILAVHPRVHLDRSERDELRWRAAVAHGKAGYGREASQQYQALAWGATGERRTELRLLAAEQAFRCGDRETGFVELEASLVRLGVRPPRSRWSARARLLWIRARLHRRSFDVPKRGDEITQRQRLRLRAYSVATSANLTFDPLAGALWASCQLELCVRIRARDHLLRALSDDLVLLAGAGHREQAQIERRVVAIRELLPSAPKLEDRLYAEMMLGTVPLLFGRFGDASARLSTSERAIATQAKHMTWELDLCRMYLLTARLFHTGLGDLAPELGAWIAEARGRRDDAAMRFFVTKQIMAYVARDDVAAAQRCARAVEQMLCRSSRAMDVERAFCLNAQVFVHLYEGGVVDEETRRLAAAQRRVMRSSVGHVRGLFATAATLYAGLLHARRASSSAPRAIDRTLRRLGRELRADGAEYARGFACMLQAAHAHRRGRPEVALRVLGEAREMFGRSGMLPNRAAACVRIGQLQGGAAGRREVDAAYTEMRRLGIARPERYVRLLSPGFGLEPIAPR